MDGLIEQLRSDHVAISDLLLEILISPADSDAGCRRFLQLSSMLLAHLQREERELCPVLWARAENYPALSRQLKAYIEEMQPLSRQVEALTEKCTDSRDAEMFIQVFSVLYRVLGQRILLEEAELFPHYRPAPD